ncbi:substrate-binding periplasmic protein [Vibrio sp. SCSIO 43137]|uniref:substrate-binding periplasmic protein n=1 Tax=Vibrio sp. SCSIO 43137 TaxID=3021011 RepID=UPI0023072F3A|nr:transporter substrate-binding domain-containing protein [Vibrio sp. SCSIO 43137]WCE31432.1 transporter substrate-binding domain-containing protein [Vibrio sp. SCSIO 43137]
MIKHTLYLINLHHMLKTFSTSLILFFLWFISIPVASHDLRIISEDFPPISYMNNGKVNGIGIDIAHNLLKSIDASYGNIELYPWSRAFYVVSKNRNTLITSMARTSDREHLFKWVGPILDRKIWLYKHNADKEVIIKKLSDAKRFITSAMRSSASDIQLQNAGFEEGNNLELVTQEIQQIKMLISKRVKLIAMNELTFKWYTKNHFHNIPNNLITPSFLLSNDIKYYIAFNINTSDEVISKLQNELDKMKKDGRLEKIIALHVK